MTELIASPSDLKFATKRYTGLWPPDPAGQEFYPELVSWEEAKEAFDAVLVLDPRSSTRVSVLSLKEPKSAWERELLNFPTPPNGKVAYEPNEVLVMRFKKELVGICPEPILTEAGEMERGWRFASLRRRRAREALQTARKRYTLGWRQ